MNGTIWTKERPDQEGWWWLVIKDEVTVVNVKRQQGYGNRLCAYISTLHCHFPVDEIDNALWSGPIRQPI